MSVVVVGGHDRMKKIYQDVGTKQGHKVKVFTYCPPRFEKLLGNPDYVVIFTDVISHKLINTALKVCKKKKVNSIRLHNSSLKSFQTALEHAGVG